MLFRWAKISAPCRASHGGCASAGVCRAPRHRTVRRKGARSQAPARLMVFELLLAASRTWRRLKGEKQLPNVIRSVRFETGVEVTNTEPKFAA